MKLSHALSLSAALAAAGCGAHESPAREASRAPLDVQVGQALVRSVSRPLEAGGVVRARTTATLVSRIVAEVHAVLVQPGDRVKAGQPLIRLDARDLAAGQARAQAGLAAAEQAARAAVTARDGADAGLALASATHRRLAELRAKNSATPHELDQAVSGLKGAEAQALGAQAGVRQAEAGVEAARAALSSASVAVSWATITAPFDGIVTEKMVEPGNMASPGVPLMTVEDTRGFRLEVRVDESRAAAIDREKPVPVILDSADSPSGSAPALEGTISEFSRALDPGSHAFLVKIDLPARSGVRSGMFGRARFAGPQTDALLVPPTAVVQRGQVSAVFVVGSDRASLRLVQVGSATEAGTELTAGVEAGERVVVAPPPGLVDGAPVREVRR